MTAQDHPDTTGPLTILIPGTSWERHGGWEPDNALFAYGNGPLTPAGAHPCTIMLRWPGGHGDRSRFAAAGMLLELIAAHPFGPEDKLNILAHSHGGNVALAASRLSPAHRFDNLITLNKPRLVSNAYRAGPCVGTFLNISARRDWIQWAGSTAKLSGRWSADPDAVNLLVDTSASDLKPHGAPIWDDKVREHWWSWALEQIAANN